MIDAGQMVKNPCSSKDPRILSIARCPAATPATPPKAEARDTAGASSMSFFKAGRDMKKIRDLFAEPGLSLAHRRSPEDLPKDARNPKKPDDHGSVTMVAGALTLSVRAVPIQNGSSTVVGQMIMLSISARD